MINCFKLIFFAKETLSNLNFNTPTKRPSPPLWPRLNSYLFESRSQFTSAIPQFPIKMCQDLQLTSSWHPSRVNVLIHHSRLRRLIWYWNKSILFHIRHCPLYDFSQFRTCLNFHASPLPSPYYSKTDVPQYFLFGTAPVPAHACARASSSV